LGHHYKELYEETAGGAAVSICLSAVTFMVTQCRAYKNRKK